MLLYFDPFLYHEFHHGTSDMHHNGEDEVSYMISLRVNKKTRTESTGHQAF